MLASPGYWMLFCWSRFGLQNLEIGTEGLQTPKSNFDVSGLNKVGLFGFAIRKRILSGFVIRFYTFGVACCSAKGNVEVGLQILAVGAFGLQIRKSGKVFPNPVNPLILQILIQIKSATFSPLILF